MKKNNFRERILFVCSSRNWGGTEKNVLVRAKALTQRGHKVAIVCVKSCLYQRAYEKGFTNCYLVHRGGDFNPISIFSYLRVIKKLNPKAVFITMNKDYWLGGLAAYLTGVSNRVMYLGIERVFKRTLKYRLILNTFMTQIIVNSSVIKNVLIQKEQFPKEKIHVIYNGFSIKSLPKKCELRKRFHLTPKNYLLGVAGRITEQKGFDLIPEMMSYLPKHIHLVIAGEGEDKNIIEKEIKKRGVQSRVHFLGFVKDMDSFFLELDLFVLCSRYEGMANVLLEAMSHGVPIISTNVSGSKELLCNGTLGPIVPIEKPIIMAKEIIKYMEQGFVSPDILKNHIQNHYSIDKMVQKMEHIFS